MHCEICLPSRSSAIWSQVGRLCPRLIGSQVHNGQQIRSDRIGTDRSLISSVDIICCCCCCSFVLLRVHLIDLIARPIDVGYCRQRECIDSFVVPSKNNNGQTSAAADTKPVARAIGCESTSERARTESGIKYRVSFFPAFRFFTC